MNFIIASMFVVMSLLSTLAFASDVDCSEAYGGKIAKCQIIACPAKYTSFLGKWSGPFSSYVRELSTPEKEVSRPFQNTVTYSHKDCLRNLSNDETFIIGRRTDTYPVFQNLPGKVVDGLLITGKMKDGSPFLRTIDDNGMNDYSLVYQNKSANMSIWSLTIPADKNNAEMRFTTIDGQDFSESKLHKRNVTVTMSVGPVNSPYWEGVISSGYHSLIK